MRLMRAERVRFPRRATWLTVVGLIMVPLVVGGLLTWALWDPTKRLDQITAAVVNLDEPVTVNGQTVPLGRQLAAALVTGQASADAATSGSSVDVKARPDVSTGTAGASATPSASGTADPSTSASSNDAEQSSDGAPNVAGSNNPASFTWVLSDQSDAAAGLADGRYGAVVTIPKDFSAAATSPANGPSSATTATLQIRTSPEARPLDGTIAQVIAQAAAGALGTQLTQSYLDNVLVSFGTLHSNLGDAANGATKLADGAGQLSTGASGVADGSGKLADGVGQLADGAGSLSTGLASLSSGATSLATGVRQVGGGADSLAGGVQQLSSGASGLASGLDQIAAQTAQSADQAAAAVPGAQQFAAGVQQVADAVNGTGGISDSLGASATGATQLSSGITDLLTSLDGLAQSCAGGSSADCAALIGTIQAQRDQDTFLGNPTVTASADQLATGLAQLDGAFTTGNPPTQPPLGPTLTQLAGGAQDLASGAQASADGLRTLAGALSQSAAGAHQLADGASQSAAGAQQLASGADSAATGAAKLATGASQSVAGASKLAAGAYQSADGARSLADGASQVASGADGVASGAKSLADGLDQAVAKIPAYSDSEATSLAQVVADPVKVDGGSSSLLGSSTVPFLLAVALWLGGLATFLVLAPLSRDALGSTRASVRLALDAFVPAAVIGVVQGGLLTAVVAFALDLTPGEWASFTTLAMLTGVAFAALNQALAALMGGVGRFISMVVAVIALATAVISTAPSLLTAVASALPTSSALAGLRGVVESSAGIGGTVVSLLLWTVAGLAVTTLAVARKRVVEVTQLTRWSRA
ncbi:YhgE/Pip domain-containing protein [Isoptericola sp. b490]|uniref:YhgE/Pip domain-containing protein n=1 Tax=Actinotalea lenta TaxID=3064654 RepID=UPI002712F249|nr:YhgE/Pip domain-containing protein [Isoptericola sp. b490]MDO8121210.1 YhgE/Pip domain-containing protein [Isoptericola sp. b490]